MLHRRPALAALAATTLLLAGCARTTPIGTLLDDPSAWDGRAVRVVGDVADPVGVLGLGTYQVSDVTGTIRVVVEDGGVPRHGAHVGVEGNFRSAFTVGTESFAVIVEKKRFRP